MYDRSAIWSRRNRGMELKSTILVIDDAVDICVTLHKRLTMEGYQVWTAPDGRKGLQLYKDLQVDLVITDVLMPEIDGLEVVRILHRLSPSLPIVVMSGGANRDLDFLIEATEFGATRTISKPFCFNELVAIVRDLIDSIPQPG